METWRHKESHRIHLNTAANLSNIPGPRLYLAAQIWKLKRHCINGRDWPHCLSIVKNKNTRRMNMQY